MFKERYFVFNAAATIKIYTDGITESMSAAHELFGEERLMDVVRSRRAGPAAEIVRAIRETVSAFAGGEPDDDLTIVLLKGK
jgi:sigma-B regulation protein RsbU (phosphoserine phosphatase)